MKVNAPFLRLRVSQACQSTLHLKLDLKICSGQFLVTKVTAGQQMELPRRRIRRLPNLELSDGLNLAGVSKIRLMVRRVFEKTFLSLRNS